MDRLYRTFSRLRFASLNRPRNPQRVLRALPTAAGQINTFDCHADGDAFLFAARTCNLTCSPITIAISLRWVFPRSQSAVPD